MGRSMWKGPCIKNSIFKKIYEIKQASNTKQKLIIVTSKNIVIFPSFVGYIFSVYNGIKFINIIINKDMVGYKLGEFVVTRKKAIYNKK